MHLADAFIQSYLQCLSGIQALHIFVSICSLGIEPTNFTLTQCSTTEPRESKIDTLLNFLYITNRLFALT